MWGFGEAAGLGRTWLLGGQDVRPAAREGRGWDPVLSEELGLEASQPPYLPTLQQCCAALPELSLATLVLQVTDTCQAAGGARAGGRRPLCLLSLGYRGVSRIA